MIEAKVIADSINDGNRITTLQLKYHRFIHSEFMTHRMFSRSASSSRAIPINKSCNPCFFFMVISLFVGIKARKKFT